jgi:[1-hydroxy-2-(trimethylamino)ethyl]phosphonate dioxygenase
MDKTIVPIEAIETLFARRGQDAYFGEPVSQLEHALQAAHLAEQAQAPPAQIVAALLHDIGHLLHGLEETVADDGLDAEHERVGNKWLHAYFPEEVCAPVRLHVNAKRYLCATDSSYLAQLSPASLQSLKLQGGPMTDSEVAEFEEEPYFRQAVQLRRWDDQAKIEDFEVPSLTTYIPHLESLVFASAADQRTRL